VVEVEASRAEEQEMHSTLMRLEEDRKADRLFHLELLLKEQELKEKAAFVDAERAAEGVVVQQVRASSSSCTRRVAIGRVIGSAIEPPRGWCCRAAGAEPLTLAAVVAAVAGAATREREQHH
jgi:hypothetical protein